jgi:hypothetical protein
MEKQKAYKLKNKSKGITIKDYKDLLELNKIILHKWKNTLDEWKRSLIIMLLFVIAFFAWGMAYYILYHFT